MTGSQRSLVINPCGAIRHPIGSTFQEGKWKKHTTLRPLWIFCRIATRSFWFFFQGHFPTFPIMPGVLIVEAMAQTAGVLALESMPAEKRGAPVFFMGMDKVKFRKPVVPGDQLIIEVQILKFRSKVVKASGQALVENNVVAEAELMATLG
jgi:3-hydroxymyristoyl/3-hydroxydecanoyl-(acyl carrier protein) dehydratase